MFGSWQSENVNDFKWSFANAKPFPHLVLDNFLDDAIFGKLSKNFPKPHEEVNQWYRYDNCLENKYARKEIPVLFQPVQDKLSSPEFVQKIKEITEIDVHADPTNHGAGLHAYPKDGFLEVHLDYARHPFLNAERRLNIILYMSEWDPCFNGNLELWTSDELQNAELKSPMVQVEPKANRSILFLTGDESFHGLTSKIQCLPNEYRNSLTIFYISDPRPDCPERMKAHFQARANKAWSEEDLGLIEKRKIRLL